MRSQLNGKRLDLRRHLKVIEGHGNSMVRAATTRNARADGSAVHSARRPLFVILLGLAITTLGCTPDHFGHGREAASPDGSLMASLMSIHYLDAKSGNTMTFRILSDSGDVLSEKVYAGEEGNLDSEWATID